MSDLTSIVFVVDDDVSVRESLELLIKSAGWRAETFRVRPEFLSRSARARSVLSGARCHPTRAQRPRAAAGARASATDMPIIFITGHGDIPMTVQAMKAGAVEFLTKPLQHDVLVNAIRGALEHSRTAMRVDAETRDIRDCYESLTPREREVMALVVSGLSEQTSRWRTRHQRDHREGAQRSGNAQDEGRLAT